MSMMQGKGAVLGAALSRGCFSAKGAILAVAVLFAAFALQAENRTETIGVETVRIYDEPGNHELVLSRSVIARILVVGGGGAGGNVIGGGGGGGAVVAAKDVALSAGSYTVVVGRGGEVSANWSKSSNCNGLSSSFLGYVAEGGGGGGAWSSNTGASGACGGGGCNSGSAGAGSVGGKGGKASGDKPGGGGGMGGDGQPGSGSRAGDGGLGVYSDITGENLDYGSGGGGGTGNGCTQIGLRGGDGAGDGVNRYAASSAETEKTKHGLDGRGGGGGGGSFSSEYKAGRGGSGCVIIRYLDADPAGIFGVTATPEEFAADLVSPAYGRTGGHEVNEKISCSAPTAAVDLTPSNRVLCTGWNLYSVDASTMARELVDHAGTNSYEYVHDGTWHEIEWLWQRRFLANVASSPNGTVTQSAVDGWYAEGTTATFTATPNDDCAVFCWMVDGVRVARGQETLTLAMASPHDVSCVIGRNWHVASNGSDADNIQGDADHPFATISNAVAHAESGDAVLVGDGVYEISAEINVTNAIVVKSVNGRAKTEIRRLCTQSGAYAPSTPLVERCVRIAHAEAVVAGFTIANGAIFAKSDPNDLEKYGAGVLIAKAGGTLSDCVVTNCFIWNTLRGAGIAMGSSEGVVTNCVVSHITMTTKGNYPSVYGLGVYMTAGLFTHGEVSDCSDMRGDWQDRLSGRAMYVSGGRVSHTRILRNVGMHGAALHVAGSSAVIDNCLIAENEDSSGTGDRCAGGGVFATAGTLLNCTIVHNRAPQGGGLYVRGTVKLVNCLFDGNESYSCFGVGSPDWYFHSGSGSVASNNLSLADFAGVSNVKTASGNLVGTPIFSGSDYALAFASPGVDAGVADPTVVPGTDLSGAARVSGAAIDIGCHEFRQTAGGGADFSMSVTNGIAVGRNVLFSAKAWGRGSDESYRFRWDFGDGWSEWSDAATTNASFATTGTKTVKLQVTFGSTTPDAVSHDLRIGPASISVMDSAGLVAAMAEAVGGTTIHLAAGTYEPGETLVFTSAVTLVGDDGREVTTINRKAAKQIPATSHYFQRVVELDHPEARVKGVSLVNGYAATGLSWSDDHAGAGVYIGPKGGTLDSCAVTNCTFGNVTYGGTHRGGGIGALGPRALVTNCLVKANAVSGWQCYAGGVYMTGGARLVDSTIDDNRVGSNNSKDVANVYASGPCRISRCRIQNGTVGTNCGGIETTDAGAFVDNCLIVGNEAGSDGGGVYASGGTYLNCTIVGNSASKGGGISASSVNVRLVNCILEGNAGGQWSGDKMVFSNCVTTAETLPAVNFGCVSNTAAGFVDAATGDYTLKSGKVPAANMGWNGAYADIAKAVDLAHDPRLYGTTVDAGCYEYSAPAGTVTLTYAPASAVAGEEVTFTVEATLGTGETPEYRWFLGDEVVQDWSLASEWKKTFDSAGAKGVRVEVRAVGTEEPVYGDGTSYSVIPQTLYVVDSATHPGQKPVSPYVDWQTAATSIAEAVSIAIDGCTVVVGPGDYALEDEILISKGIRVISSEGPLQTIVRRPKTDWDNNPSLPEVVRVAHLQHAKASIEGFTLTGGHIGSSTADVLPSQRGAGVLIESGTLVGCVVTNNLIGRCGYGAGVALVGADAVVTNCVITGNSQQPGGNYFCGYGFGVYMKDGLVTHSDLVHNDGKNVNTYDRLWGLAVYATGGTLRKCRITDNSANAVNGEHRSSLGVVYADGSDFVCDTCLIADNDNGAIVAKNDRCFYDAVYAKNGTFSNCTVAGNIAYRNAGVDAGSDATFVNCIFDGNAVTKAGETSTNYTGTAKSVTYCVSRDATLPNADSNVRAAVAFRNPSRGDYRPKAGSSVVDKGLYADWMATATDLSGKPRATAKGTVDIGAYQANHGGLLLVVR